MSKTQLTEVTFKPRSFLLVHAVVQIPLQNSAGKSVFSDFPQRLEMISPAKILNGKYDRIF